MANLKNVRIIVVAAVCFTLVIMVVGRSVRNDEPKASNADDYSDLAPIRRDIPDKENAFTYLSFATNAYVDLDYKIEDEIDKSIEGGNWATNHIIEILAQNEKMFEWVDKAVACERCQVPAVTSFNDLLPYISKWRNMARLMALRVKWLAYQGKHVEALDYSFKIIRFGHMVENCSGPLLNYLVGLSIKGFGLMSVEYLVGEGVLPDNCLLETVAELEACRDAGHGIANAFRVEFVLQCNTVDDICAGKMGELGWDESGIARRLMVKTNYIFKPADTKALMAAFQRDAIMGLDLPLSQATALIEQHMPLDGFSKLDYFKPNAIGRILFSFFQPSVEGVYKRRFRKDVHITANQILFALAAYKRDHDELPGSLTELSPHYLEDAPIDSMSGNLFGYSKGKRIIYSFGFDMVDDGGDDTSEDEDHPDRWRSKDAVFKIAF